MGRRSKKRNQHSQPKTWGWGSTARLGGVVVVVLGAAVLLVWVLGRPGVSVSSSPSALAQVHTSGIGSKLTEVEATSAGRPVTLVRDSDGLVPETDLAQDRSVRVTVTASPPSWLHWLLGSGVSATKTVRTPSAGPSASVALASRSGHVPVRFASPVSVVDYRSPGGPSRVVHLRQPATVADVAVPAELAGGTVQVAAAPRPWEMVSSRRTVTWFVRPAAGGAVALADPAPGTATAASNSPIILTFAQPVKKILGDVRPTLSPAVAGSWSEMGLDTLVFTPSGFGFGPGAAVTVGFDRPVAIVGASTASALDASTTHGRDHSTYDAMTTASTTYHFSVGQGSLLRLDQILAQLDYLPLNFVPAPGVTVPTTLAGEAATITKPLAGTFTWRWASTPAPLQAQWAAGSPTTMLKGALMAFDSTQPGYDGFQTRSETVAQLASSSTWDALVQAAAANRVDPAPYSYVYVTKTLPETLTLWQNGSVVLTSLANTGIEQRPTGDGTFPIYVRYTENYMTGTNPDGTTYDDLVPWINYFNGGDAVHGFVRGAYGYPQSLGCVELPLPAAKTAFSELAIGDLVTVAG